MNIHMIVLHCQKMRKLCHEHLNVFNYHHEFYCNDPANRQAMVHVLK
jgi:hypothetical protein